MAGASEFLLGQHKLSARQGSLWSWFGDWRPGGRSCPPSPAHTSPLAAQAAGGVCLLLVGQE